MVGLHALEGHGEECLSPQVNRAILGGDGTLSNASRPQGVAHGAPRVVHVGAKKSLSRLSSLETRRGPLNRQVDDCPVIVHRLNCVCGSILGKFDCAIGGIESRLVLAELVMTERRGAPKMLLCFIEAEYLGVELAGRPDAAVPHVSTPSWADASSTGKESPTPRYYR